jgi:hypothetical protein
MISLLEEVLEAHGGLDRWRRFSKVEADAVTGGGLFPLKGLMPDLSPRRMSVWLKEERASVLPFGAPDQRTSFAPERLAIENLDSAVVAEWSFQRSSFVGHGLITSSGSVHRAYSLGPGPSSMWHDQIDDNSVRSLAPQCTLEQWSRLAYIKNSHGLHLSLR